MKKSSIQQSGEVTVTSRQNETLHWAYLEFAIRSARSPLRPTRPPSQPASRNVIEAIRYSYDFIDAATEFAHAIVVDDIDGSACPDNWLSRFMTRSWPSLSLSDKLGLVSFVTSSQAFWRSESQRQLFEDLRCVRNALTHPGIFGVEREERFSGFADEKPMSSQTRVVERLNPRRRSVANFASTLGTLGREDAHKAVEIAVRHAGRFEQLFGRPGACLFGRLTRRNQPQNPDAILAAMKRRYFDAAWSAG